MRHKTNRVCDIIILTVVCLNIFALSGDAYSKNNKKTPPVKNKTDIVNEDPDSSKTLARGENTEDVDNADPGKKKEQTGITSKEYKEEDFKPVAEEESYVWLVVKTIFILGFIVGVFYFFLKYVTKKAGINVLGTDAVQVLSMVPIGQNKFLQIIDIAGKVLVLGVSDNSINLITEINDKSDIDRIRMLSSKSGAIKGKGFQEALTKHISSIFERISERKGRSGDGKKETSIPDGDFDLNYLKKQRNRLKNLGNHDE